MNKRIILSLTVIIFVVALSLGSTFAWFTDSVELENTFTAGTLSIDGSDNWSGLDEGVIWDTVNPGDCKDKEFTITNDGTKNALIRFNWAGEWGDIDGETWAPMANSNPDLVKVTAPDGWYKHTDGWYYYLNGPLAPNSPAFEFAVTVCVDGPGTGNEYQGKSFKLDFTFEALQASNNASGDVWSVDSWYFDADGVTAAEPTTAGLDLSADNWAEFDF